MRNTGKLAIAVLAAAVLSGCGKGTAPEAVNSSRERWATPHAGAISANGGSEQTTTLLQPPADGKSYRLDSGSAVGQGCLNLSGPAMFGGYADHDDGSGNCPGAAAAESVLYSFRPGADGNYPDAGLIQAADGTWYGTTYKGGPKGFGTVYLIAGEGEHFSESIVHYFGEGSDGRHPTGGLIQAKDGSFYGTTQEGGAYGKGTVFRLSLHGAQYTEAVLHSFGGNATDGYTPQAGLVLGTDGNLYGTTGAGGSYLGGTAFRISIGAKAPTEAVLYSFGGPNDGTGPSGLTEGPDGVFYGTTYGGGPKELGTIFGLSIGGAQVKETIYHTFEGGVDGEHPAARLIRGADGAFYGTTYLGGEKGAGTVFRFSTAGGQGKVTILYSFGASPTDGKWPKSALVQAQNGAFYGTTAGGGASTTSSGTVYRMMVSGDAGTVQVVHSFGISKGDGKDSVAGIALGADSRLYGTTNHGGATGRGTIYQVAPN